MPGLLLVYQSTAPLSPLRNTDTVWRARLIQNIVRSIGINEADVIFGVGSDKNQIILVQSEKEDLGGHSERIRSRQFRLTDLSPARYPERNSLPRVYGCFAVNCDTRDLMSKRSNGLLNLRGRGNVGSNRAIQITSQNKLPMSGYSGAGRSALQGGHHRRFHGCCGLLRADLEGFGVLTKTMRTSHR